MFPLDTKFFKKSNVFHCLLSIFYIYKMSNADILQNELTVHLVSKSKLSQIKKPISHPPVSNTQHSHQNQPSPPRL